MSESQHTDPNQGRPNLIAIFDLITKSQNASNNLELNFLLVNLTKQLVNYQQGILYREGKGFEAISGLSEIDVNSPMLIWLKTFIHELHNQNISGQLNLKNLPSHIQKDYSEWFSLGMAIFPFWQDDKDNYGYLILTRKQKFSEDEIKAIDFWLKSWSLSVKLIENPHVGQKKDLFERFSGYLIKIRELAPKKIYSFFSSINQSCINFVKGGYKHLWNWSSYTSKWHSLNSRFKKEKSFRWKVYSFLILFLPIRLSIISAGEIVASHPLIIRAPIEGVIEKFYIEPNSLVKKDQKLFNYDNAALISKTDAAKQSYLSAEAEYREATMMSLADSKQKANLVILQTKAEEKRTEYTFLLSQVTRSEMAAPIDGWAIFDDPAEQIGKPINIGEKIMMLADPNEVEIQAWVALSDMIDMKRGSKVTIYPNPNPFSSIDGVVKYITYEPVQVPEGYYAYRLRAMITPGQNMPRLGIKGTVKVSGNIVPLCYWVLRKPIAQIRQFVGF
jgi:hypothetical protein